LISNSQTVSGTVLKLNWLSSWSGTQLLPSEINYRAALTLPFTMNLANKRAVYWVFE